MTTSDLFYTLALLRVDGIGDITAKKLLQQFDSAEKIFSAPKQKLLAIDNFGEALYKKLHNKNVLKDAQKELDFITQNNIDFHYFQDGQYPDRLKQCIDAPVVLFTSGNCNWNAHHVISIVGTRNVTPYGAEFTRNLIADLVPYNPLIVSGFAYGVDIVAHQAALDNGLQTLGVLAHGLNQIYPKIHKRYVADIEKQGGFMTEFWSSANPDRENFIKRNRIVAGLSQATIVIESAEKGGSLITAHLANDYNREVFAVPGRITDVYSQGCNTLIKTNRAQVLTQAADLVYMLNWDMPTAQKLGVQKQLFINLDPDEQLVYDYLQTQGKETLDSIALRCSMPVFKLSSLLLNMELKGVVRPLPGKNFEVI